MRAVVTGAAVRVGRAIAEALGAAGFDLVLHHNRSPVDGLADGLRAAGRQVDTVSADLSTVAGCEAVIDAAMNTGPVDVLVNNAALYSPADIADIDAAAWDRMQAVNCRAPFLLARGLAPALARSGLAGGGLILNMADIGAERPAPGFVHYAVSKAGIVMLTKALAVELAPAVRCTAIAPGTVLAPTDLGPAQLARMRASIPAQRFGDPSDIARLVVFLATQAPYVSGQVWAVDGGRSVVGPLALDRPD